MSFWSVLFEIPFQNKEISLIASALSLYFRGIGINTWILYVHVTTITSCGQVLNL